MKSVNEIREFIREYLLLGLNFHQNHFDYIDKKYSEPHRHYHNWLHVNEVYERICKFKGDKAVPSYLFLAAVYHDVEYYPDRIDNEIRSIETLQKHFKECDKNSLLNVTVIKDTCTLIQATTYQNIEQSLKECRSELKVDLKLFLESDLGSFSTHERKAEDVWQASLKVFKEYQFVDFKIFKEERIKLLEKLKKQAYKTLSSSIFYGIEKTITLTEAWNPKIGIYPGSFNPFHVGHLNILQKAEKIFDKVIIAVGVNPEKQINNGFKISQLLKYHQVESFFGLLTNYIDSKEYQRTPTIIRGIRNITDVQMELNQYRWNQELSNNEIEVISIFCDKEFEHISSSSLKQLISLESSLGANDIYEKYVLK